MDIKLAIKTPHISTTRLPAIGLTEANGRTLQLIQIFIAVTLTFHIGVPDRDGNLLQSMGRKLILIYCLRNLLRNIYFRRLFGMNYFRGSQDLLEDRGVHFLDL